jgi:hypothetical protein
LPVADPKPAVETLPKAKPAEPQQTTDEPLSGVNRAPNPEYVFRVQFTHRETRQQRIEEVKFGPDEIAEASLDGLGATGPRGREIALRLALERVPPEFVFAGAADSVRFDMGRLVETLNRD